MGFGNEMKDFISAMQAGEKLGSSKDDREYKKLRNELLKSRAKRLDRPAAVKAGKVISPEDLEYKRLRNRRMRRDLDGESDGAVPNAADDLVGTGKRSALDVDADMQTEAPTELADMGDLPEYETDTAFSARGGAVEKVKIKKYALGGAVEDDDEEVTDDAEDSEADDLDEQESALPVGPVRVAASATTKSDAPGYSIQAGHDAALEGIKYSMKEHGESDDGAVATDLSAQRRSQGSARKASGADRASRKEVDAVEKIMKERHPDADQSEITMMSLSHIWEFNLRKNNPEGAKRAAASLVEYSKAKYDRLKNLAAAAAEHGSVDDAISFMQKAHGFVADGARIAIDKQKDGNYKYTKTDIQSGKVVEQAVASPEDVLAFAQKSAGQDYNMLVARAAGERKGGGAKPEKEDKVPALDKRDAANGAIEEAMKARPNLDPEMAGGLKHIAGQIITANDMAPDDVLDAVKELVMVPKFKATPAPGGGATVKLGNGREIRLSRDAIGNLDVMRGKAKIKMEADIKKQGVDATTAAKRQALEEQQDAAGRARIRALPSSNIIAP